MARAHNIPATSITGRRPSVSARSGSSGSRQASSIPIGAAIVVLIGVMVLSKGR